MESIRYTDDNPLNPFALQALADNQSQYLARREAEGTLPTLSRICWRNPDNTAEKCDIEMSWRWDDNFSRDMDVMQKHFPSSNVFGQLGYIDDDDLFHNWMIMKVKKDEN